MSTQLSKAFASVFGHPLAAEALSQLTQHITLDTFCLTTSSLRHLKKWYDRLDEIQGGKTSNHPNYYSDPESIGLVRRTKTGGGLTPAGKSFQNTRDVGYNDPRLAEYYLMKVLFYESYQHSPKAKRFLEAKRSNLFKFLTECSPTPNKRLLIEFPRLLTVAEYISTFPYALTHFLQFDPKILVGLAELGEHNFKMLGKSDKPKGFAQICRKIGSDYTRAALRRLNTVIAMALLEVRQNLIQSRRRFDRFEVPYPFCNLVSEADLFSLFSDFTNDIEIVPNETGYTVFLKEEVTTRKRQTAVQNIHLKTRKPRAPKRRMAKGKGRVRRASARSYIRFNTALGHYAEGYIEKRFLSELYGSRLIRIGHTDLEQVPLSDNYLPGADFVVGSLDAPELFIEIKATQTCPPGSIQITIGEYLRAKKCHDDGVSYVIYIAAFDDPKSDPQIWRDEDFAELVHGLSIEDLTSLEMPISLK